MAAKTLDEAAFWNSLLMAKSDESGFPSEFPYEIDSPVESALSSTESADDDEAEEHEEEEEDFLAELTRRLTRSSAQKSAPRSKPEKAWPVSGSPKSTLNGLGGWPPSHGGGVSRDGSTNGSSTAPSPPTTPFVAESRHPDWDPIYAAAGQVARMRLSGEVAKLQPRQQPIGAPVCSVKSHSLVAVVKTPWSQTNQYQGAQEDQMMRSCSPVWPKTVKMSSFSQQNQQVQSRIRGIGYERCDGGRPLGLPQSAWPSLQAQNPQQNQTRPDLRALLVNGSGGVKRECAGTGVFLPRRYENPAPEPRKRSGCSTVLLPAKVVQALNLNLDDVNAHSQQRFASDYDVSTARRNAFFAQQKRSLRHDGGFTHEVRLPQEWTY